MKVRLKEPLTLTDQVFLIAMKEAELWHTPEGEAWATIDDGQDDVPVSGAAFRDWLHRKTLQQVGAVSRSTINTAIDACGTMARLEGPEHRVHLRVARSGDAYWIDLGPNAGFVRITKDGWTVHDKAPLKFRRPPEMLPLPEPEPCDDPDTLRPFVQMSDEAYPSLPTSLRHRPPLELL